MNIQQFEELSDEEKAVWIGERLLDLRFEQAGVEPPILRFTYRGRRRYAPHFPPFPGERGAFKEWLHTMEGIDAIEQAMIEKGYNIVVAYEPMRQWYCRFDKVRGVESAFWFAESKSQAIITAAAKALMQEQ